MNCNQTNCTTKLPLYKGESDTALNHNALNFSTFREFVEKYGRGCVKTIPMFYSEQWGMINMVKTEYHENRISQVCMNLAIGLVTTNLLRTHITLVYHV